MDHSDDERVLEALSADVSRTDPRWQRRWRLEQALLPARAPSWAALAASFALLMVSAALLDERFQGISGRRRSGIA